MTDIRVPLDNLTLFVHDILKANDKFCDQSEVFTEALIWSDLIGRPTHGVWRLATYLKRMQLDLIKCPCEPAFKGGASAVDLLDGGQGVGHYIGSIAMNRAIEKAKDTGVGLVGVHNSNHFGTGAYYVNMAAQAGMLGFAVSNSIAKVAPHGGVKGIFGTNPFAFGAPRKNNKNLMLDMATSASAGSAVMKYAEAGLPMPAGIAIADNGEPITDPNKVNEGALLTFGGAKGYGISLMVEILSSVITGAAFSTDVKSMFGNFEESGGNGHVFLAVDIGKFLNLESFLDRMEELVSSIKGTGLEGSPVLIPGETRWDEFDKNMIQGVPLDSATCSSLATLAQKHQLTVPWL